VTALLGHRPRTKTARQIIAELDHLYALGWRSSVFFVDDNLIGNKKYLKAKLLPALIEWQQGKMGFPFTTEASINLADDDELIELMVQAGFVAVFIGIETPDEDSLAECSKKQNLNRDLIADVKRMQRAGLRVRGGFIVGFDNDTHSIFQRQIDFIQQSGIVMAMVGLLQAIPGTRLYERLRREDRLLEDLSGDNVDGSTNIVPKMDPDTLYKGYQRIMQHIYSPKHYHERVRTLLREYRPPSIKAPFDVEYLLAFFRSIYHLGIVDKTRVHYWKLFIWSLFHRPALFPLAITMMIYGAHFRRICEM
jgi:radical SAM superfamily enzyme YgiQ (UPF0313 family)